MGAAVPLALGRRIVEGESRTRVLGSVLRRTVILLLIGFLLNLLPRCDFSAVRIPGVLQRLALCYLSVSLVFLASRQSVLWGVAALALIGVHWAVLALAPVPGYGPGVLEPEERAPGTSTAACSRAIPTVTPPFPIRPGGAPRYAIGRRLGDFRNARRRVDAAGTHGSGAVPRPFRRGERNARTGLVMDSCYAHQ